MSSSSSSRHSAALAFLLIFSIVSCNNDEPSGPSDPGGNGGPTTILSSADPSSWESSGISYGGGPGVCLLEDGVFRTGGHGLPEACHFRSVARIDFTLYSSARVQCRITKPTAAYGRATILVKSNVPGTPDLYVIDLTPGEAAADSSFDVSLENALSFKEPTIQVSLNSGHAEETKSTVADLRVVATPR